MSRDLHRSAYGLIWRLGRHSLVQTLRIGLQLIERQAFAGPTRPRFEAEGMPMATVADLEKHPAVREYSRLAWRGWRIDYDQTPQAYWPGAHVVMKRGRRFRLISIEQGRV